jgi:SulP family sulfate permease
VAVLTFAIIIFTPRLTHRIPGTLIAVLLSTLLVALFGLPVDTIGQPVGQAPIPLEMGLPAFSLPQFTWHQMDDIVRAALVIAMLGAIESLLSAVVADGMVGTRHRSNTELVAQGIANVVTPFYGGIPATGAIARTATNVRNGGRTPVAGIIHALVLLLIVLCFGKYASMIPMAALAGILLSVAINMSEYRMFLRMLYRAPKSDTAVMLITFLLTVFLDLTVAIPVGLVLASFLFMHRMEKEFGTGRVEHNLQAFSDDDPHEDPFAIRLFDVPDGVLVYDIHGPFFFGAANKFQTAIEDKSARVAIFRMRNVPVMDATGINVLEEYMVRAQKTRTTILFSGIRPQPMSVMRKFGLLDRIGMENIHQTIVETLLHAADIVEKELHQESVKN